MPAPATPHTLFVPGAMLDPSVVAPLALVVMGMLTWHLRALRHATHPPSRRRIRSANAIIMLAIVPLFAVGVSLIDPQRQPRAWLLLWLAVISLVWMSVVLALLDVFNTLRMARVRRRRLRALLVRPPLRITAPGGDDAA